MTAPRPPGAARPPPEPPAEAWLAPFEPAQLDAVLAVEQSAYPQPWTRGHFLDAHAAGNYMPLLWGGPALLGYLVAMPGVDEVHLLNLTVAPAHQRQGWAHWLLGALALWAQRLGKPCVWLEVRRGNARAIDVYQRHGFATCGVRRGYYPASSPGGAREDALVMSWPLQGRRFEPGPPGHAA